MAGASLRFLLLPPPFFLPSRTLNTLWATWASCGYSWELTGPDHHVCFSSLIPIVGIHPLIYPFMDITECLLCNCPYWMLETHSPRVQMGLSLWGNCVTCSDYRVRNWQTLHHDTSWFVRYPPRPFPNSAILCHFLQVKLYPIELVTCAWFPFHTEKGKMSQLMSVIVKV